MRKLAIYGNNKVSHESVNQQQSFPLVIQLIEWDEYITNSESIYCHHDNMSLCLWLVCVCFH